MEDEFDEKLMGELNNLSIVDQLHDGKTYPDVPDDFDPVTYLLINRDVLRSRMDPITHYILYGKNEGRTYCYLNKSDQLQVNTSQ